jgi:hypothetical protein
MAPSSGKFATWLKVEVWLSLAFLALAGVVFVAKVFGYAISTHLGGFDAAIPYVLGAWALVVVGSVWYVGRLDST